MNTVKVELHKYHIHTATEFEIEEGSQSIQFAVFTERVENLMLRVKWINPIGKKEGILIQEIQHIEYVGTETVEIPTEMELHLTKEV